METNIHHMVPPGLVPMEKVVQTKGEHGDGPVGLMTGQTPHGLTPEIIPEELAERGGGEKVSILLDGEDIVVDEVSMQAVGVAGCSQQRWHPTPPRHLPENRRERPSPERRWPLF